MDKVEKKKYIQIAVIVCAFGATGFVLYNGLFKSNLSSPEAVPGFSLIPTAGLEPGAGGAPATLLPYGDDINSMFEVLKKNNLRYGQVNYPRLNPNVEVGVEAGEFVKPLPEEESPNP